MVTQDPVRASRKEGYQCFCGGLLSVVDASETGLTFICPSGGHGWLYYFAWGFDGKERWVRSDAVYERIAQEMDERRSEMAYADLQVPHGSWANRP